jgi:actin-like ATPase involved in cell morphogenesis
MIALIKIRSEAIEKSISLITNNIIRAIAKNMAITPKDLIFFFIMLYY